METKKLTKARIESLAMNNLNADEKIHCRQLLLLGYISLPSQYLETIELCYRDGIELPQPEPGNLYR